MNSSHLGVHSVSDNDVHPPLKRHVTQLVIAPARQQGVWPNPIVLLARGRLETYPARFVRFGISLPLSFPWPVLGASHAQNELGDAFSCRNWQAQFPNPFGCVLHSHFCCASPARS